MIQFFRRRIQSFKPAIEGVIFVLKSQQNTWFHAMISMFAIGLSFWLDIERIDWAIILLTMGMVWMAEFLNTALEAVVDLASPKFHPLAKIGKDIGAAAVLISSLAALLVGLIIFIPPLIARLGLG